ncbi:hypothetical protein ACG2F4_13100 [Halalkalibaculum sp. DA3122]|uniref:hypothetical protein n=1 Tax=Halalkalibaculum sp. DA3122 TaxID=3373607 RepID=UPI0037548E98
MDQTIKHITQRLVNLLPEEADSYSLSDLRESGWPRFVVKRVEVELQRNLAESIVLPETEWAEMESDTVQHAWKQFVEVIRTQARLPASYASPVLETAISDILEILVQPRRNLPDVIFGAAEMLDYEEVAERMDSIVVYRHFASLIPRYMERKGYIELSKEQCRKLIIQADEKLTARYTSLNWAQMLEPLFLLMGEEIDSSLLRMFFEDKRMPRIARQFDNMNRSLNRSELIEQLSTPDLPGEDEQNEFFLQISRKSNISTGWEGLVKPVEKDNQEAGEQEDYRPAESGIEQEETGEDDNAAASINTLYREEETDVEFEEMEEEEDEEAENALNQLFADAGDPDEDAGSEPVKLVWSEPPAEEENEPAPRVFQPEEREKKEQQDEPTGTAEKPEEPEVPKEPAESGKPAEEREEHLDEEEEEQPMWLRFLDPEEEQSEVYLERGKENSEDDTGRVQSEPLVDFTTDNEMDTEELKQLKRMLRPDRSRFVEEIFRGSEKAYEEALKELSRKDNWRNASQFIEKEIFNRNLVDMYSEVAVDFTDSLHNYFIEILNQN